MEKDELRQTYDEVAADYDHPANFFSRAVAESILRHLGPLAGSRILDAGTGTGVLALHIAANVPDSQVIGIDLSSGMLEQARHKANALGLSNVDFRQMDMEALAFEESEFDTIVSGFSLYFLNDMAQGLRHLVSKLTPNGVIVICFYRRNAFMPLSELFIQRYSDFRSGDDEQEPWKNLLDVASIRSLCGQAGIKDCSIQTEPLGFYLSTAEAWWDILWNTGYRRLLNALSAEQLVAFRAQHLDEVDALCKDGPYWVDTDVVIAQGVRSTSNYGPSVTSTA